MMSSCVHKPDLFWYFSGLQFSHLFFFHKYYSIWRAKQGGLVSEGWTGLSVGRRSSSSCNNHSTALQFVLPGKHKLDIVAPIQQAFWWPHKIILTAVESKWKGVGGDDWDFLGMSLYIRPWLCADGPADGIILWKNTMTYSRDVFNPLCLYLHLFLIFRQLDWVWIKNMTLLHYRTWKSFRFKAPQSVVVPWIQECGSDPCVIRYHS